MGKDGQGLSRPWLAVLLALGGLIALLHFFRYDVATVQTEGRSPTAYRLDRWTGNVEVYSGRVRIKVVTRQELETEKAIEEIDKLVREGTQ